MYNGIRNLQIHVYTYIYTCTCRPRILHCVFCSRVIIHFCKQQPPPPISPSSRNVHNLSLITFISYITFFHSLRTYYYAFFSFSRILILHDVDSLLLKNGSRNNGNNNNIRTCRQSSNASSILFLSNLFN